MDTLVYGVGTKAIVLRMNWWIHSYTILYRNIMLAQEKNNTIAKNLCLTMRAQTLISNESIKIQTRCKNIWTPHMIRNKIVSGFYR